MKKHSRTVYLLISSIVGGLICVCIILLALPNIDTLLQQSGVKRATCNPPPDGFSDKDLVGTWVNDDIDNADTLTIREDGKYKQIIHIKYTTRPDVNYETDWQPWRVEYIDDLPYLHLEGMRLCAINPALNCDHPGGKGGFYDFCRDEPVYMDNEGILLVLGVSNKNQSLNDPRSSTRWINLWVPMGSENTFVYHLQNP